MFSSLGSLQGFCFCGLSRQVTVVKLLPRELRDLASVVLDAMFYLVLLGCYCGVVKAVVKSPEEGGRFILTAANKETCCILPDDEP